jgi:hypothetical protein
VTTYHPSPAPDPPPKPRHDVALWAGAAAFFGSLLTVGIFDVLDPGRAVEYLGAILVALITAGGVYSKERLDAAKREDPTRGNTQTPQ